MIGGAVWPNEKLEVLAISPVRAEPIGVRRALLLNQIASDELVGNNGIASCSNLEGISSGNEIRSRPRKAFRVFLIVVDDDEGEEDCRECRP